MNIILLEKIKKLGDIGDEVKVKSGYARNFLVPNKKALYATSENKKYFEEKKTEIKSQNDKLIKDAKEKLKIISGQEVTLIRAASDTGQLFGSVSTKDIVNSLAEKNISILKNEIDLNISIKNLTYEKITINLHPEVSCEIILNVARSSEEASTQKKLGKAVSNNAKKLTKNVKNLSSGIIKTLSDLLSSKLLISKKIVFFSNTCNDALVDNNQKGRYSDSSPLVKSIYPPSLSW